MSLVPQTLSIPPGSIELSFAPFTRLFVVTVSPQIREDSRFLTLLLEASERTLEMLVVVDGDFRHRL